MNPGLTQAPAPARYLIKNQPRPRTWFSEIYDPETGPGPDGFVDPGRVLAEKASSGNYWGLLLPSC